ncbi:aldehyde dehydrogenase family protein [Pseudolysinimonas sp.]|jgi:acyl-CoA reductase-like NAD-dependent aldehyde dehydrogenase|uniref:aldehyde dehydrogenase family protein n=1 Tax=Pseudolysinimonas sp. TaxID=2680009 RepID=UPI003783AA3C
MSRLSIPKTYKLAIGGKFPRSESGRTYEVTTPKGVFLANASLASRKDARDAVVAARAAVSGWAGATAYNRGQVLYRIAELLEGRRDQFIEELRLSEGASTAAAAKQVDAAIDAWVWYAGWTDKFTQVAGSGNPVAGPYFNLSVPEPTGVVAAIAPQGVAGGSLLGFVTTVAPILVAGNTVIVIADETRPLSAVSLAEVLATSDVPGGVVNVLTGSPAEMAPWLASHADVNALDLAGAGALEWIDLEIAAADTLKRVVRPEAGIPDLALDRILAFTETKTVWHTKALI